METFEVESFDINSPNNDQSDYASQWGRRYLFDNWYKPPLQLSAVMLHQAGEIIAGDGYDITVHDQFCSEISYVVSGQCDFYTDDQVFHAKEGDIHVISPGKSHYILANARCNLRMAYIGFSFREPSPGQTASDLEAFYQNAPLYMRNDKLQVKTAFEQLLTEIYLNQSFSQDVIDACITQILVHVYRIFKFGENKSNPLAVDETRMNHIVGHTVFQALRYIDSNIEQITSVSQVTRHLQYNPAYLSRIFHKRTGITIQDYIIAKKIQQAKTLLENGMRVTDVTVRLGYASCQSFRKMFQKHVGCSPSAYQKKKGG